MHPEIWLIYIRPFWVGDSSNSLLASMKNRIGSSNGPSDSSGGKRCDEFMGNTMHSNVKDPE
jgi:hypothetical protein